MADVFISYARERRAAAEKLIRSLTDQGYDVWWDDLILPTGAYFEQIERQLGEAKAVIVIWSPESVDSHWVRAEAARGLQQRKLVNTHTDDLARLDNIQVPWPLAKTDIFEPRLLEMQIPMPFNQTLSVSAGNVPLIVRALDVLKVPRSGAKASHSAAPLAGAAGIDDDRLFAGVEREGTANAYKYYLWAFRTGRHARDARWGLAKLEPRLAPGPGPDPDWPSAIPGWARAVHLTRIVVAVLLLAGSGLAYLARSTGEAPADGTAIEEERDQLKAAQDDGGRKPGEVFRDCPICPTMVVVPAGSFTMGSPPDEEGRQDNESPQRQVVIGAPLAVGKYEVTFREWDACVQDRGCRRHPEDSKWGRGKRPVVDVSWYEVTEEYLPWLKRRTGRDYRLLSEAEWEYAARGGTRTRYAFGDTISRADAHFFDKMVDGQGLSRRTVETGSFPPNAFGLHDMHGNVWEWCRDTWHPKYADDAPADGEVWKGGDAAWRVLRGGSWDYGADYQRSATRLRNAPGARNKSGGFRVARTP
jgi:formylglycine-generating enzyme required for sulfatase activity